MKIGFDGSALNLPITGIGRYTQQIIKEFDNIKRPKDEIIYFWGPNYRETDYIRDDIKTSKHTHRSGFRGKQSLWEQLILPSKLKKHDIDIYYSPRNKNIPYFNVNSKIIITMHDTLVFLYPIKNWSFKLRKWRWNKAAKIADKIITISKNSKKDLLNQFNFLKEDDIFVSYCGVSEKFKVKNINIKLIGKIKKKYNIDKNYLLTTGSTEPVKNIKMLFDVIEKGKKKYPETFNELELIITGPKWPGKNFPRNISQNIKFIGYVDDSDLPILFNGAELFLFPSLYEGFGLPPLEAMASETMVISTNTSSLPEVVGDAGIMLDPKNPQKWVEAINEYYNSDKKTRYIKKGLNRIEKFSWKKIAKDLYEIFDKEMGM